MSPRTLERRMEAAVSDTAARLALRNVVVEAMESGVPRDDVYAMLEVLRQRSRDTGREREEDLIMDVMDLFHGLAHPSLRV